MTFCLPQAILSVLCDFFAVHHLVVDYSMDAYRHTQHHSSALLGRPAEVTALDHRIASRGGTTAEARNIGLPTVWLGTSWLAIHIGSDGRIAVSSGPFGRFRWVMAWSPSSRNGADVRGTKDYVQQTSIPWTDGKPHHCLLDIRFLVKWEGRSPPPRCDWEWMKSDYSILWIGSERSRVSSASCKLWTGKCWLESEYVEVLRGREIRIYNSVKEPLPERPPDKWGRGGLYWTQGPFLRTQATLSHASCIRLTWQSCLPS